MADGYDLRDKLVASVDADLGGCVETDKSTIGIVVFLNCGPISWKSRKQETVGGVSNLPFYGSNHLQRHGWSSPSEIAVS